MDSKASRSEEVLEAFKKRKLANSALHKIHRIIESFDDDRETDIQWARVGFSALFILLLISLGLFFFGTTEVTIS